MNIQAGGGPAATMFREDKSTRWWRDLWEDIITKAMCTVKRDRGTIKIFSCRVYTTFLGDGQGVRQNLESGCAKFKTGCAGTMDYHF